MGIILGKNSKAANIVFKALNYFTEIHKNRHRASQSLILCFLNFKKSLCIFAFSL
jgi:hypothetical protein